MRNAALTDEMEKIEVKGWIEMPDRLSFSAKMITKLIEICCPLEAVSLRRVQQTAKYLTDLGIEDFQNPIMCSNTPYYSRCATEMILAKLKFKVKTND